MIVLRVVLVIAWWPFVYLVDRTRGYDPPARLSTGLDWARRPR